MRLVKVRSWGNGCEREVPADSRLHQARGERAVVHRARAAPFTSPAVRRYGGVAKFRSNPGAAGVGHHD